jgi:hypothetical protein
MSDLETVMQEVAPDYYFLQPGSTRSGVGAFVDDMFDILHTPGLVPRAREAAQICEAVPVTNPNAFQEKLRAAVFDLYRRTVRPHPRIEDMAAAFADTLVAPFTSERIETRLIAACQDASAIAQLNQTAWILRHPASIDRAGHYQIVVAVNDLLVSSALGALLE